MFRGNFHCQVYLKNLGSKTNNDDRIFIKIPGFWVATPCNSRKARHFGWASGSKKPEEIGGKVNRNVGLSPYYKALQSRRPHSSVTAVRT
jgi:hypothetical protein